MEIDGPRQKQLREALLSAFPTRQYQEMMVSDGFNENLPVLVKDGSLEHMVYELVLWAQVRGRLEELVTAVVHHNPRHSHLSHVAKQFGLRNDQTAGITSRPNNGLARWP